MKSWPRQIPDSNGAHTMRRAGQEPRAERPQEKRDVMQDTRRVDRSPIIDARSQTARRRRGASLAGSRSRPECLVLDDPLGEACALLSQEVDGGEAAEHIEQDGDGTRPSRLVAGIEAGTVVS